jgi:hypothetical protein
VENYATTMPAFRPGTTLRTDWVRNATAIQPLNDAVPSLADGRGAVAGVSNHDATAKSGPPRGEPR